MARQKLFNEEAVVENAMKVFWEKGYDSASISELLTKTGLNKGSLYHAFGSKEKLFTTTLRKYDCDYRQAIIAKLEALNNPQSAISGFFDAVVSETVSDQKHKGCFIINTASEFAQHNEEVNTIVSNGIREIEGFFQRNIEVGQARNEISNQLDPNAIAKTLLSLIIAIRVLGRGVFTEDALQTIAMEGKRLITL
ncbi:MAG: TetR/AcrR family transcriptional regulator [Ghiorsea sp.]